MVIDTLHSDRFCDLSPYQVYAQLLDDGQYLCGIRTMYRILNSVHGDVKERRRQVSHRHCQKPVKTLKYCPQFPGRFGSIQDARSFCQQFFSWYNKEHRHSDIGLMTPEQVHYGLAQKVYDDRRQVLLNAFEKTPQRFKGKVPKPHALPKAAWINKPKSETLESNLLTEVSHSH